MLLLDNNANTSKGESLPEGVWFNSTVHLSGCLLAHAVNVRNVVQHI